MAFIYNEHILSIDLVYIMKLFCRLLYCLSFIFYRKEKKLFLSRLHPIYKEFKSKEPTDKLAHVCEMLILAEDHRFYMHLGVDLVGIARAIIKNIFSNKTEGGSTIEQQLVRTITGDYRRKISRKFKEMLLATIVGKIVAKQSIPELYLYVAYFGYGMIGIKKACSKLELHSQYISLLDSARLVARLKYPEPKNTNHERRRKILLRTMYILDLHSPRAQKTLSEATFETI